MRRRTSDFTSLRQIAAVGSGGAATAGALGTLAIFDGWSRATGAPLSRVTRPVAWDGRRLVVEVSDPVWMRGLQGMAPRILEALNELLAASGGVGGARPRVTEILFEPSSRPHGDPGE